MSRIFDKFRASITQRVNVKFGTVESEDLHDSFNEIINDFTSIQLYWNEVLYPIVSTMAGQSNQKAKRLNEFEIDPISNGFDSTQIYVDRLTNKIKEDGIYYNLTLSRPNTIKEQFKYTYEWVRQQIADIQTNITDSDISDAVKERIGINAWDESTPSLGTTILGPSDESIDARSLNNKINLNQLIADIFGVVTPIGSVINATDYQFTQDGVRTLEPSIRQREIVIENLHGVIDEYIDSDSYLNHNIILQKDPRWKPSDTSITYYGQLSSVQDTGNNGLIIEQLLHDGGDGSNKHLLTYNIKLQDTNIFSINTNTSTNRIQTIINSDFIVNEQFGGGSTFFNTSYLYSKSPYIVFNYDQSTSVNAGLQVIDSNITSGIPSLFWESSSERWKMTFNGINNVTIAELESPHLSGTPTTPTPPVNDSSLQIANTQWVTNAIAASGGGGGTGDTYAVFTYTLTSTDETNKYITLPSTPGQPSGTQLFIQGAPSQIYSLDYTISGDQLSWSSLGLDSSGIMTAGENISVVYGLPNSVNNYIYTLTSTDETNKYITLPTTPTTASNTVLLVRNSGGQIYSYDYTVSGNQLSWSGLGLDINGLMTNGTDIVIYYD